MESRTFTIEVYLNDGTIFQYNVGTLNQVRSHAYAIANEGYAHNNGELFEYYPAWRILKVKCKTALSTIYPDQTTGV